VEVDDSLGGLDDDHADQRHGVLRLMSAKTLKFKKGFRSIAVEIEGKDEAIHRFKTVPLTRSVEKKLGDTLERAGEFDQQTTDEDALRIFLDMIDEMVEPEQGKKTKASKVLLDLWKSEEIESADVIAFLNDLVENRRPT
jgi:hypothetical protein